MIYAIMYDLDETGDFQIGTYHGRWEFSDPCSTYVDKNIFFVMPHILL